jgi:hypothetical protein
LFVETGMRRDWLQAASDAFRRNDHRNVVAGAVAGLGAAIAIGVMEWFSLASHYPLFIIPFASSIVLVIGSPEAEPAQPRALIGGHANGDRELDTARKHFLRRNELADETFFQAGIYRRYFGDASCLREFLESLRCRPFFRLHQHRQPRWIAPTQI